MSTILQTLQRLAVKRGVTLGNLPQSELFCVLAAASLTLEPGLDYTEAEANAALKAWLSGTGSMLHLDHVELRRTLIDYGAWHRDGYGRHYARADVDRMVNVELAQCLRVIQTMDVAGLVESERGRASVEREARKQRALEASGA